MSQMGHGGCGSVNRHHPGLGGMCVCLCPNRVSELPVLCEAHALQDLDPALKSWHVVVIVVKQQK